MKNENLEQFQRKLELPVYCGVNAAVSISKNGNPVLTVEGGNEVLYGREAVEAVIHSVLVPNVFKICVMNAYLKIEREYLNSHPWEEESDSDSSVEEEEVSK